MLLDYLSKRLIRVSVCQLEHGLPVRSAARRCFFGPGVSPATPGWHTKRYSQPYSPCRASLGVMTIFSGFALLRGAIVHARVARANSSNFVAANDRASAGSRINAILRSRSDCGPIFSLLFSHREMVTGFTARHSAVSLALFPMAFLRYRNSRPVMAPCFLSRYSPSTGESA
jgi:hypothetical protein